MNDISQLPAGLTNRTVDLLNHGCFCITLDAASLRQALDAAVGEPGLADLVAERCPHAFAAQPVFISGARVSQIRQLIQAVETVVAEPAYQAKVLAHAPAIARHRTGACKSVFFGYDVHLHDDGIALIEINTNAGGALLNAALARAQRACCAEVEAMLPALDADTLEHEIVAMFRHEWQLGGLPGELHTIAIVDENPGEQYLYPEFLLFQRLFRRHGIEAIIADPAQLAYLDGALRHGDTRIDLVYNRSTDFLLEHPGSAALRAAYLADAAVVTPHPHAHALYANKGNLALLGDAKALQELGIAADVREILAAHIPRTEVVDAANAERLWAQRKQLFFKPLAGYGSRAAYRGDKLTKRVFTEILAGGYVAQALVAPPERAAGPDDAAQRFKFDVRAYAYDGQLQWLAARLYQGQTTNFRTPGGGFAPLYRYGS